jgi:hypothetical protein
MKNLFDVAQLDEVKGRLANLRPDSERLWGSLAPAQAVEHCSRSVEMALGDQRPPRMMIGRLVGPLIKRIALGNESPFKRNSPTAPNLVVADERDLDTERERLYALLDRFSQGGTMVCTTYPHSFFGRLSPDEWAILMYKHLDHHLRQFGV